MVLRGKQSTVHRRALRRLSMRIKDNRRFDEFSLTLDFVSKIIYVESNRAIAIVDKILR